MWRGTLRSFDATLDTAVPLESTLGYTTVTVIVRHVSFDGAATNNNLFQIGSGNSVGLLMLATRNGGSALDLRVLGTSNSPHVGAVSSPDLGTYTVPGGVTSMASFLNSGWHVVTLALKQGQAGKVVLDGTTVVTNVDSDGFGPTTVLKLNALSNGDNQSGYAFKFAAVGAAFTDSDITTMHAELAG
jgi:hypothetical protein